MRRRSSSSLYRKGRAIRRLALLSGASVCTLVATLAISVPAANAYVRIDSRCILRAYQPYWTDYYSGFYHVSGEVDCSGNSYPVKSEIQVCSQVYNGSTGQWYTVSGSCGTETTTAYINQLTLGVQGVCGHEYRTWDWAYLPDDGATATYTSSGAVDCSQPA